jgi:hypothetical protein
VARDLLTDRPGGWREMDVRRAIAGSLDLWGCMWTREEQACFETAVIRALGSQQPRAIRLAALALCETLATSRLLGAAARLGRTGPFDTAELRDVSRQTMPLGGALRAAARLRGNLLGVELLVARALAGRDPEATSLLDWVDVRDLVAVARTTVDARVFAEVQRRISRRGPHQRARAALQLGFRLADDVTATGASA